MDTIKTYLDNLFRSLPNTEELKRLKSDLLVNMEDKYLELKANGKSENEAVGIVIAEFGNIDELLLEMGISKSKDSAKDSSRVLTIDEAHDYIGIKKYVAKFISIGVAMILFGVSLLIFMNEYIDTGHLLLGAKNEVKDIVPILPLFILIIIAVSLFIYAGMKEEKYKFIANGAFKLDHTSDIMLKTEYEHMLPKKSISIILSVGLFILSPLYIFIGSMISDSGSTYGVCLLLLQVALGVGILVIAQSPYESYEMLLKVEDYTPQAQKQGKLIGAVASIVWPLAVAIFLYTGIVKNLWQINWIIFPITGIIFGGFCAFYSALKENETTINK